MENVEGRKICPGLYALRGIDSFYFNSNPNKIELYLVSSGKEDNLIATDIKGDSFSIKDPRYHDRNRNPINPWEIDCFDLIPIERQHCETLKSTLTASQERTSKLLKFLNQNKPSSS